MDYTELSVLKTNVHSTMKAAIMHAVYQYTLAGLFNYFIIHTRYIFICVAFFIPDMQFNKHYKENQKKIMKIIIKSMYCRHKT